MKRIHNSRLTIGLIIDWIVSRGNANYYQAVMLSGIGDFARENDINLITLVTGRLDSPFEWERSRNILFQFIHQNNFDGLIVLTGAIGVYTTTKRVTEVLDGYQNIPVVTINEGCDDYPCIAVDNYTGMKQIVDHVIETHGSRRIAFIKGVEDNYDAKIRFEAYLESLRNHGIPYDKALVYQGNFLYASGNEAIKELIDKRAVHFDAIVAANDNMAIGALTELYRRTGIIPDNIPITGFDDVEVSKYVSLTTARQNFYDQAKLAASTLLRLIQGENAPLKQITGTEFIIRSSCGCMTSRVTDAFTERRSLSVEPFPIAFQKNKNKIISRFDIINKTTELSESNNSIITEELLANEQKVLDAIYDDFLSNQGNKFLNAWRSFIFWAIMNKINLLVLQDILSVLRNYILSCIAVEKEIIKFDDLFQAARILIGEAMERVGMLTSHSSFIQTDDLDSFGEELISNLECDYQMELLYKYLPGFGINKCFISLYEDPQNPLGYSRLIFAFTEDGRLGAGATGIQFFTRDLLPKNFMIDLRKKRFNIIIQSLYQGDNQLGFAIFGYESKVEKAFETVRYRLSVALKGSLLIQKIKQQAQNLETQVIERTKDLSLTNQRLEQEIDKRKKAEEKLRKVLNKLETYNKELHHLTLRDELTGLYNRRGFMTLGSQHYNYAKRAKKGFMLLFADLDGLKQVNDQYGHMEGDNALKRTTHILNDTFRNMDIVARLGGDEFTILVADALPRDEKHIIKRIHQLFDRDNQKNPKPYKLSISIGAAYFDPEATLSFDELLIQADKSLYNEKLRKKGMSLISP